MQGRIVLAFLLLHLGTETQKNIHDSWWCSLTLEKIVLTLVENTFLAMIASHAKLWSCLIYLLLLYTKRATI